MIAQSNMELSDSTLLDISGPDADPAAIVDALDEVITDIDSFLSQWFERLSDHAEALQSGTRLDESLRRRIQDFEQEQLRWKAKRNSEQQRIDEKAEQLTQAWLRLEAEQRRFLQIKESHPSAATHRSGSVEVARSESIESAEVKNRAASVENERITDGEHFVVPSQRPAHALPTCAGRSREAAVQQFQQLRREIESSRPGSGKL